METDSNGLKKRVMSVLKSRKFQLYAIILVVLYVAVILVWKNQYFPPIDPHITPLELDSKAKMRASIVHVGLHVNNFPKFSFVHNEFLLDGILWFKFPQGVESINTIENFTIHDSILRPNGRLLYKSAPIIKLIGSDVLVCYHIQVLFKASLNFKNFPLESHCLSIIIQNKSVTPYELYFSSNSHDITIDKKHLGGYWKPREISVQTGYFNSVLNSKDPAMDVCYPVALFSINFENVGVRDLISLYFPILVLFFVALFCLLIDVSDISRLTYVAGAVPALVLFRLVIDGASPACSYATNIDFVYYLLVFLALLILLFQTYVVLTLQRVKELSLEIQRATMARLSFFNRVVFLFVLLNLVIFITYACIR